MWHDSTDWPSGRLVLQDGTIWQGVCFGAPLSVAGEVVFNTGMTGYPETLTDPSYAGQILVLTYPLIGNYGVPGEPNSEGLPAHLESGQVQVAGLIVADYSPAYSHWQASQSLGEWLQAQQVPALCGIDTRALTRRLRENGTLPGRIEVDGEPVRRFDPDRENLVAQVSPTGVRRYGEGRHTVVLIDCGAKANIIRHLLRRGLRVVRVPWDYDLSARDYDGLVISNGPGNPKMCRPTILQIRSAFARHKPVLGICLGHQLMALAAGANTYKMKYGHRGQNQPVIEVGTGRGFMTSQNHGYAVDNRTLPEDWQPWFENLNDGTNEGLRHRRAPFFSVQFHPEASPGPVEAEELFDRFVQQVCP